MALLLRRFLGFARPDLLPSVSVFVRPQSNLPPVYSDGTAALQLAQCPSHYLPHRSQPRRQLVLCRPRCFAPTVVLASFD